MKVLFHVDEADKWKMTLANVNNFLSEVIAAEITVLANGEAVKYYSQNNDISADLLERVDFVACQNSLNGFEIDQQELDERIRIVAAGVVEIAKKQEAGYSYIRP
ncbi:DsrE family protein [Aerococcaceae bacterium DSM 111176]|nr:DsrE family protein [Aerococcaceae bacterium DSM 111176]